MDEQKSKRNDPEKKSKKKADKKKHKKSAAKSKHSCSNSNNGDREALLLQNDPTPTSTAAAAETSEAGKASPLKKEQQQRRQQQQQAPPGSHPFPVDDSDHCETPLQAYNDLEVVLDCLLWTDDDGNKNSSTSTGTSSSRKRPRSELRIYDPYYCDGGVKTKLASMGFTSVINRNRDFYEDIASNNIPEYDVLVTNPPYSGEHMERILEFCKSQSKTNKKKAFFLLLPHFVYTKDYYQRALSGNSNANANASYSSFFYFLVPEIRYAYIPPAWVAERSGASKALVKGKETTAPFPSFWYCHQGGSSISNSNSNNDNNAWLEKTFGPSGSFRSSSSKLRYAGVAADIPRDFKGEFDATKKRPNPRARKRQRQKQYATTNTTTNTAQQQKQQQQSKKKKKRRY